MKTIKTILNLKPFNYLGPPGPLIPAVSLTSGRALPVVPGGYKVKDDLPATLYGQLCSGTERYVLNRSGRDVGLLSCGIFRRAPMAQIIRMSRVWFSRPLVRLELAQRRFGAKGPSGRRSDGFRRRSLNRVAGIAGG